MSKKLRDLGFPEPHIKRVVAFIDGQNLYHSAKELFGRRNPDYDIKALVNEVCKPEVCGQTGWIVEGIRFYSGHPPARGKGNLNARWHQKWHHKWHQFWRNKGRSLKRDGVVTTLRPLKEHSKTLEIYLPDLFPGDTDWDKISRRWDDYSDYEYTDYDEKGIDVRIAIDVIRHALTDKYDIAIIFSQDQDLCEIVEELKLISREKKKWMDIYSVYPYAKTAKNKLGIFNTNWIHITQEIYERCIDSNTDNYFPKEFQETIL